MSKTTKKCQKLRTFLLAADIVGQVNLEINLVGLVPLF